MPKTTTAVQGVQSTSSRNAGGSGRQRRNRQRMSNFVTKRQMNGGRFTPSNDPPTVDYQPWNRLILVHVFNPSDGSQTFTAKDFQLQLKKQVDPNNRGFNQIDIGQANALVVQFRFKSFRVWNTTGKHLAMSVEDFTSPSKASRAVDQLCGLMDSGSATRSPAIGYSLPSSASHFVVRVDTEQANSAILNVQASANDQLVMYTDLWYKFDGPVTVPKVFQPMDTVIHGLSRLTTAQQDTLQSSLGIKAVIHRLERLASKADSERPSTIQKVVDGVKYGAMIISALTEGDSSALSLEQFLIATDEESDE